MKRILSALVLVAMLTGSAFGLSDKEYKRMKSSSKAFRDADRRLSQVWSRIKSKITRPAESAFEMLKAEQLEWIESERDKAAEKYMIRGHDRDEAYALATDKRIEELEEWEEYTLSEDE